MLYCCVFLFNICYLHLYILYCFFFFFQAEDGIRDDLVTGVQTCALPIWRAVPSLDWRARRAYSSVRPPAPRRATRAISPYPQRVHRNAVSPRAPSPVRPAVGPPWREALEASPCLPPSVRAEPVEAPGSLAPSTSHLAPRTVISHGIRRAPPPHRLRRRLVHSPAPPEVRRHRARPRLPPPRRQRPPHLPQALAGRPHRPRRRPRRVRRHDPRDDRRAPHHPRPRRLREGRVHARSPVRWPPPRGGRPGLFAARLSRRGRTV